MTLCWSRHQYAELVWDQKVPTWLGCHRRAFEWFGGIPKRVIIDNAKCAIIKACYYEPTVQRAYADCAEGYGFIIDACPPREPKKKGRVESGVKYVKNNFLPLRELKDLHSANQALQAWVLEVAGNRTHGSTQEKPLTRFEEIERSLLKPLPDVAPELCAWEKVRCHRDCHVRFEKCRYSAPHSLVGQELWLRASETSIRLYQDYEMVAIHPRINTSDIPSTCTEHLPPQAKEFLEQNADWCRAKAAEVGEACYQVVDKLLSDKKVNYLRAAQGVLKLEKDYGKHRLLAACQRAIAFDTPEYHSVKQILGNGLESESLPPEPAFDRLSEVYRGQGKFCRNIKELIH